MARNGTDSKRVRDYFEANPGKTLGLHKLRMGTGIGHGPAIASAISYLNHKYRNGLDGGMKITTITRGQSWAYYPEREAEPSDGRELAPDAEDVKAAERLRAVANKITAPLPSWHRVPAGKPPVSFKVIGTLMESGELVLQGESENVQGVWMARRVG